MSGMSRKPFPITPGMNSSGTNAATVVRTAKVTGLATSPAPAVAPCRPSPPSSWRVWMLSPTMTASSTTMPSTRMNAKSDTALSETSSVGISAIAPRNEIGMPRLTQKATRSSRKSASTTRTSANPAAPLRSMSASRSCRIAA